MGTSGLIVPSVLHALFHFFRSQILDRKQDSRKKGGSDWNNDSMKPCSRTPSLPRSATTRGWRPVCRQTCRPSSCSTAISAASPGKIAIVHADLITGLAAKEISVDFLHSTTLADGIISTRTNMIQRAKELQMIAILRVFLIDSMAFDAALGARNLKPDAIDILPGLMPSMIRKVRQMTGIPVLTGGLITEKREVMQALEAGALAISSTAPDVWRM